MKKLLTLLSLFGALATTTSYAQRTLTMEDAIELSLTGSPELQQSALNLERYQKLLNAQRASLKSQFSLDVSPLEYRQSRDFDSRLSQWYTNESFESSGTFSIAQPIVWTGATLSLNNRFGWQNNISDLAGGLTSTDRAFSNSLYLSLNQPLFTYNRMKVELETIEMDYENALLSYALTRLSLEQNLTQQFYDVYLAQNSLAIAKEELVNAQQNYDVIQEKVKLDLVPRSELFQAELNLSTAQSDVENSVVSLESAKDELKIILGLGFGEQIEVSAQIEEGTVVIDPQMAVENALATRLELRQREIVNKLSEYDLIRIKDDGKFQGDLGLSIGLMGDNPSVTNIYDNPTTNPSVQLSFSVPIFDWGARRDRIQAQRIRMQMEKIDTEQELVDIEMNIRRTCRNLHNQMMQISMAKRSVDNAQQTYDLNVEKYRAGEISGLEMSQFQSQLSGQKNTLAQRLVSYKIELLNLKVLSLYDFEKGEPISPMLMYDVEQLDQYTDPNYKKNKKKK